LLEPWCCEADLLALQVADCDMLAVTSTDAIWRERLLTKYRHALMHLLFELASFALGALAPTTTHHPFSVPSQTDTQQNLGAFSVTNETIIGNSLPSAPERLVRCLPAGRVRHVYIALCCDACAVPRFLTDGDFCKMAPDRCQSLVQMQQALVLFSQASTLASALGLAPAADRLRARQETHAQSAVRAAGACFASWRTHSGGKRTATQEGAAELHCFLARWRCVEECCRRRHQKLLGEPMCKNSGWRSCLP